jgi:peptide/nickel transport system substrate-binding protein
MLRAQKRGNGRARGVLGSCAAAGLALILAACGPASAGSTSAGPTTPVNGGVVTYAMLPSFNANYIFPMVDTTYDTVANANDFQYLMYRPLYWFGVGTEPYLNAKLSLAYPPTYDHQRVTIRLKNYQWSNGAPVTAQDVMFWLNMLIEDGASDWGGYVPGEFPSNISDPHAIGTNEVTMTVKGPFSQTWFTDNELSQITPMPAAWDRTAAGPSDCNKVPAACTAVYNYLNSQATNKATWGSSRLWGIVDGPWHVLRVTSQDYVYLGINPHYSGTLPPHHISEFVEQPFTSEQAEFNVMQDPQGGQKIDVGYLPTVDAPAPPPGALTGQNPVSLSDYKLSVVYPWQLSYFPYNFQNTTGPGAIFRQQYFRTAFQSLMDQEGVIDGPLHGYGKATIAPVADYPISQYLSPQLQRAGDQWELNPVRAKTLLSANGWTLDSAGVQTCTSPGSGTGHCGPGVSRGAHMNFTLGYSSGLDWMESQIKELVSNASLVGIHITATATPIDTLLGTVFGCQGNNTCGSAWQLADWGSWTYTPDYMPTGEELFEAKPGQAPGNNAGDYYSAYNNALIAKTLDAKGTAAANAAMWKWENWLAPQLPVVYQPNVASLIETVSNLNMGVQNSVLTITPEDWYYLK